MVSPLKAHNIQYFPERYVGLHLNYETYSFYIAPCNSLQGAVAQYTANHALPKISSPWKGILERDIFSMKLQTAGRRTSPVNPRNILASTIYIQTQILLLTD